MSCARVALNALFDNLPSRTSSCARRIRRCKRMPVPQRITETESLPDWVDRASLDSQGCVDADMPCAACGYNLHALTATGHCPECGVAVFESLRQQALRYANSRWVGRLANGTGCLFATLVSAPLTSLLFVISKHGDWLLALAIMMAAISMAVALIGTTLLTEPEPGRRVPRKAVYLRCVARYCPAAAVCAAVVLLVVIVCVRPKTVTLPLSLPYLAAVFFGITVSPAAI